MKEVNVLKEKLMRNFSHIMELQGKLDILMIF